jgi:tetratricopeptide (TPR) repeat protein
MLTAIRSLLFLIAAAIAWAGGGIVSLRPLYTEETVVSNSALVDLWTDRNDSCTNFCLTITLRIEPDGDSGYDVILPQGQQVAATMHLVQLSGETIADIVFNSQESFPPKLDIHFFARIRVDGDTLHTDFLGGEKLLQQIERTGSPRFERLTEGDWKGDVLILPASTADLRQFLVDCLKQPDAFGDSTKTSTLKRAGPKERAADLNQRSRTTANWPGAGPEAYAAALQEAEEAITLVPTDADYWSTLGAARYRAGRFSEALVALTRAEQLRKSVSIEDLIFRAMSHKQLRQEDEAKAILLGELSKLFGDPRYLGDMQRYCGEQDKRSRLEEAEDLIVPKRK